MNARSWLMLCALWLTGTSTAGQIGTEFSYQGELKHAGVLANGAFDFRFELFDLDAGGVMLGGPLDVDDVVVVDGVFTVELDFGSAPFAGDALWLAIGVREGSSTGTFTDLTPRQKITAVPYAMHAEMVAMNAVGGNEVDPAEVQLRVDASCLPGSAIRTIGADGTVSCETDTVGLTQVKGSDIVDESITAADLAQDSVDRDEIATDAVGSDEIDRQAVGLDEIKTNEVQRRVSGTCPPGQAMASVGAGGTVSCSFLAFSQRPTFITTVDDPTDGAGTYTSIAIGADGLPVISYRRPNGSRKLAVCKCNDPACSGGDETITEPDPANDQGEYSSIALGTDGFPVISYLDGSANVLKVLKCNDPACAGVDETITTVDPVANVGFWTSIAIGADGFPVISYVDLNESALKVAKCDDPACTGGGETTTIVDNPLTQVGSYSSIAVPADGLPVISYQDATGGALKVVKCDDAACSGGGETVTVVDDPPSNSVGESTSLAIGTDGLPVISYRDTTADDLKVVKCNDPACAGGDETVSVVDGTSAVGEYTSIAIGADGLPVISYYNPLSFRLLLAKCNDPACTGGDETLVTVDDPANFVGEYSSIAIGVDGLPVISYFDASADALRVAKCGSATCQ